MLDEGVPVMGSGDNVSSVCTGSGTVWLVRGTWSLVDRGTRG